MFESLDKSLQELPGGIRMHTGEMAWPPAVIPQILSLVLKKQWIILGGDVLTLDQKYTFNNWYFSPNLNFSLKDNVLKSVEKCRKYITEFIQIYGEGFLFVLVISNTFVGGTGRS